MAVFLNTFLPDSDPSSEEQVVDEGIMDNEGTGTPASPYQLIREADVKRLFKLRKPFSHKGSYGHALLVAGDVKTMGAALLCAKACIYGGAGLTTVSIPESGLTALNTAIPEVMFLERKELLNTQSLDKYNAIAVGPGVGKQPDSILILENLIALNQAIIADADALNILAEHPVLLSKLPENSVLSPHMKEFDTLFGQHNTWWERLQTGIKKAKELKSVIILKNQYTFIIDQEGQVLINSTGNPAMAQGGMGDVLTGLLAAYYAQGYSARTSAVLACYFHGKAGDDLSEQLMNVTATQVAERIPGTVKSLFNDSAAKQ